MKRDSLAYTVVANNWVHSGVSTLLKTIAGETKGLSLDDESEFNYRGMR